MATVSVSISLTCFLNLAEFGSPVVYQLTCLRISRMAVYSPLYSSSILAWRSMVSCNSFAVGSGHSSPVFYSRFRFFGISFPSAAPIFTPLKAPLSGSFCQISALRRLLELFPENCILSAIPVCQPPFPTPAFPKSCVYTAHTAKPDPVFQRSPVHF